MKKNYYLSDKKWLAATFVMATLMVVFTISAKAQHFAPPDDASRIQEMAPAMSLDRKSVV